MKRLLTISCLSALIFSSYSLANENLDSEVLAQLNGAPSEQAIQNAYQANPESVLDILAVLLNNDNVDPQFAIAEALNAAPEQLQAIANLSRETGVSNEAITTAALLAGLDPTEVSEATAAGIPSIQGSPLAPPATPAVGSNGGGGAGVVSPN